MKKRAHPEKGLPGGVSRGIDEEERGFMEETAKFCIDFTRLALNFFKEKVISNRPNINLILSEGYRLKTCYIGLVDDYLRENSYEGYPRVIDPDGKEIPFFSPEKLCGVHRRVDGRMELRKTHAFEETGMERVS